MKTLLLLPVLFLASFANAQHYVRTKHNFGITASYDFLDQTHLKKSFAGIEQGNAFAVGVTHEWNSFLYPEIFLTQHTGTFPASSESVAAKENYKLNGIGSGLTAKIDLFEFDSKKKNGYCFGRVLNLIFGGDYVYNLKINAANPDIQTLNEADGKIGLGMYSIWGGSAKNHEAWTIHWEAYYKYGFMPFMKINNFTPEGNATSFEHSSIGVKLIVMHFKTYKFSEM